MESNFNLAYKDTAPAKPLTKAVLNKMVWRSLNLQASFNYERMQAAGWLWSILPGLEAIHSNKDDLSTSMTHNLEFFNTHPFLVTFVMGIVLSMEQQKADINSIRAVRVAAMGPLGGIGDALFWFTLVPITAGITANMAISGNLAGPIIYFLITFGVQMALRYWLMYWSYDMGTKAIEVLTANAREFTHAASMLGVFVVGALTCNYGATKLGMVIPNGQTAEKVKQLVIENGNIVEKEVEKLKDVNIDIQAMLDGILPALIPLGLTLMCYFLIKKKGWSPTKCIMLLLVIGIVGCVFGIWAGDYKVPELLSAFIKWHK
ncbi:PTS system mannose/fructose/sorbose family transporter subunit IID [Solobacterium sp.]|jgi:PTS system mannose/fructose/sorbose family IID component|uniref:PTS system mannose/fructose/sorbose family transporter subunit IID n=1 Tax=Solobacterium sp. TaxID=2060878 RepID=UPI001CB19580|nr:PTS system mannose/fructose/sorbose family transporter subunit IID [Solobacterium sp.]MBF1088482.1 PTS system mannose/fructose/sorbose family transporter subunit IID [Solobacterium sp.]